MLDFNRAEKRAIVASTFLVGLGSLTRLFWAADPQESRWQVLEPGGSAGPQRAAVSEAVTTEARAKTPLAEGERIDVATADRAELRRLPGVGPSLAEAIVRERNARPFAAVSDLERVPGIGPATLTRLESRITVSTAAAGGMAAPAGRVSVGAAPASGRVATSCGQGAIDINAADAAELEGLPGVGPALATRILRHRAANGPFSSPEDLRAVNGLGASKVARLSPHACFR